MSRGPSGSLALMLATAKRSLVRVRGGIWRVWLHDVWFPCFLAVGQVDGENWEDEEDEKDEEWMGGLRYQLGEFWSRESEDELHAQVCTDIWQE